MSSLDLAALLTPHQESDFLVNALGINPAYSPGNNCRLSELMSWPDLNDILSFTCLAPPRLHLWDGEKDVPEESYSTVGQNGFPRILLGDFNSLLGQGMILTIESIEQIHRPILKLCRNIESRLRIPVSATVYAGWREAPHSQLSWNDHEALYLQIAGTRLWAAHPPTVPYPTTNSLPPMPLTPPTQQWELRTGDVLYMPRGWWHVGKQDSDPALYLGITFRCPTGLDIIGRLNTRLELLSPLRANYPRFVGPEEQSGYFTNMQDIVAVQLTEPGLFRDYSLDLCALSEPCVCFSLPSSAMANPVPPSEDFRVELLVRFPASEMIHFSEEGGDAEISFNGKLVRLDHATAVVLQKLIAAVPPIVLDDLARLCGGELSRNCITNSLAILVKHGVIALLLP